MYESQRDCRLGVRAKCGTAPPTAPVARWPYWSAKPAFHAVRRRMRAARQNSLTAVGVRERLIDSARHPAQRCAYIQTRQPRVPDCARRLDQLLCPRNRLKVLDAEEAEKPGVRRNGRGNVEVTVVGGPAERGAQIGEFGGEPGICLPLARAVPQREDVGLAVGEKPCVGRTRLGRFPAFDELLLGELADGLQHRKPGPTRRPICDEHRLAHQRVKQIEDRELVGILGS